MQAMRFNLGRSHGVGTIDDDNTGWTTKALEEPGSRKLSCSLGMAIYYTVSRKASLLERRLSRRYFGRGSWWRLSLKMLKQLVAWGGVALYGGRRAKDGY